MMNNENTALMEMEQEKFMLPAMAEGDFSQDELSEDMAGMQMSFQRVKIPGGGVVQFEMPSDDPENPDYVKLLEGVILHHHASNAYWPEGSEYDDDALPLCSSVDGLAGAGSPGILCSSCPMNQFGSGKEGRGKACKNMRQLYLLRSGEYMPLQVTLPPTSLSPFREFMNQAFVFRRRASFGSVVQIGLKKVNNGPNDYSIATFKRLYDFEGEDLAQIRSYATSFKEQIKASLEQRATVQEDRSSTALDYDGPVLPAQDSSQHFCISREINGEREALPA